MLRERARAAAKGSPIVLKQIVQLTNKLIMEKILFRINLYAHNEKEYLSKREQLFKDAIEKSKPFFENESDWKDFIRDYRIIFQRKNPCCHYNDIVGYAEVSFYNTDIQINYYMNGDKRKKYNKNEYKSIESNKIYKKEYSQGNAFPYIKGDEKLTNASITEILAEVLEEIEKKCNEWKIYFNKEEYLEKIYYFDFKKYIAEKYARAANCISR